MNFEETEVLYNVYRGILRNNRSFQPGKSTAVEYRMDCPEYADLLKKYPFEKIAGKGTDLQRAIRVLKYLSPKLTHSPWYDGHVDCNALALLDYSLDKPEQGINCLNKAKILEEVCLALGIYARRVRFLPYSPFDFDCHVVTEIYDRPQEKWCMLDPTTNGYLVDEKGTILSLLEARERMADTRFVTYCKATSRGKGSAEALPEKYRNDRLLCKESVPHSGGRGLAVWREWKLAEFPAGALFYPGMERCKCRIPVGDGACLRKGICGF